MNGARSWIVLGAVIAILACVAAASTATAHDGVRVASGGDPYRVSAAHLRHELTTSGIEIRFTHPRGEPVPAVTGVGSSGRASIGFEFQLYPSSDQASVRDLGRLRAPDFGWRRPHGLLAFEGWIRGVLGNVAYAQYEESLLESHETQSAFLRKEAAEMRVLRALDNALFRSFPARDPYAQALSPKP